jgi:hypothetical protein
MTDDDKTARARASGPHIFPATVRRGSARSGGMTHVEVPEEVVLALKDAGVRRVQGELDGHPFARALHVDRSGLGALRFGRTWLRDAGVTLGQRVILMIEPEPNPDQVEPPPELREALDARPTAWEGWKAARTGHRRSLAYSVERGKREETRNRRAERIVDDLLLEMGLDPDGAEA